MMYKRKLSYKKNVKKVCPGLYILFFAMKYIAKGLVVRVVVCFLLYSLLFWLFDVTEQASIGYLSAKVWTVAIWAFW